MKKKCVIEIDTNIRDQLTIIKQEIGCTYNELISCLLYSIGVHQGFLSLPTPLSFAAFKKYVKNLRKEKRMRLNR